MKIFFPVEVFYPSQAGGPANTVYWVTKNIIPHGFEPIIVATDKGLQPDVDLNKWSSTDGGRVIYVRTRFLHVPLGQTMVALSNFYRADVVHISSVFFPTAFITAFAARILGKKMVWSVRGELDGPALTHSGVRKRPILWAIKKFIGRYPTFHSTCDEETAYIKNIFGTVATVVQIPNYLEVPRPVERSDRGYLLYIGRIHPKKAIDNLIRALPLSERFMRSGRVLKIAGTGKREFVDDLHELVDELHLSDKVIFTGQVEGAAKQQMLADASWTIMPSHTENFGVVVLESLAQSTPVLASKGSPWSNVEKEKVGFWASNDPETLAAKIDEILAMPESEYAGYRNRSRPFVEREFDIARNIDKWTELYNSL
jgi:glycosyltransferase involved in cell wall biosynthesis